MGKKSAENVVKSLSGAKQRGLARVLVGLAIRHVGETMAEDLAAIYRAIAVELPCPGVRLWPGARPTTTAERLRP